VTVAGQANDFNSGGSEGASGLGEEAVEEAGPVLHPPEPGPHQRSRLTAVLLGKASQQLFQVGPDRSSRFAMVLHRSLDRRREHAG
jgi:hypothetical protein